MSFIDTHAHLDGHEFDCDRQEVLTRAAEAGCTDIFLPAIDLESSRRILALCQQQKANSKKQKANVPLLHPMVGLHPEEVRADWREQLAEIKKLLTESHTPIAIGEVGLDFYWSREFEQEQLEAFEEQVRWSVETRLPLMIHSRKAQNEIVHILKRYKDDLPGGVFHCFTGNELEARELLQFPRFVLGIGGVLTFKKSHLPETLAGNGQSPNVPLDRIVLETDSPYMAPVPMRGQRNEPAYIVHVIERMAQAYGITPEELAAHINKNVARVFASTQTE